LNPKDSLSKHAIVQGHWQIAKQKYGQAEYKTAAESFKKVIEYPDNAFFAEAKSMIDSCEYYSKRLTEGYIAPEVDSVATYSTGLKGISSIISSNMQYPEAALSKKVSGKVWVSFVLTEKGKVVPESVKVVRGIGSGCDEEAVRLIKMMNNWTPAYLKGRPVRFQTVMHISFNLQ
jgi:TonB family protein